MKAHMLSNYERGHKNGIYQALSLCAIAVHNLYGWGEKPVDRITNEALRIQEMAKENPDIQAEINEYIRKISK
mgnify:CR=1 FL=1